MMDRPPDELVEEQAYLVSRGVRALSLLGHCEASPDGMLAMATFLERHGEPTAIPFVLDRGDGCADYGFAASRWVLDLYSWLAKGAVPDQQKARIVGLLLGYGVQAIRDYEEGNSGRLFPVASASNLGHYQGLVLTIIGAVVTLYFLFEAGVLSF